MRLVRPILLTLALWGCAGSAAEDVDPREAAAPAGTSAIGPSALGGSARAADAVHVRTELHRTGPGTAVLRVELEPAAGFRLAVSPPNEVHLELPAGVRTHANPALIGELAPPVAEPEVVYADVGAAADVPIRLEPPLGSAPLVLHGTVVYRACDDVARVCTKAEQAFVTRLPGA